MLHNFILQFFFLLFKKKKYYNFFFFFRYNGTRTHLHSLTYPCPKLLTQRLEPFHITTLNRRGILNISKGRLQFLAKKKRQTSNLTFNKYLSTKKKNSINIFFIHKYVNGSWKRQPKHKIDPNLTRVDIYLYVCSSPTLSKSPPNLLKLACFGECHPFSPTHSCLQRRSWAEPPEPDKNLAHIQLDLCSVSIHRESMQVYLSSQIFNLSCLVPSMFEGQSGLAYLAKRTVKILQMG